MGGEADQSVFLKKLEKRVREAIEEAGDAAEEPDPGTDTDSQSDTVQSKSEGGSEVVDEIPSNTNKNHDSVFLWVPYSFEKASKSTNADLTATTIFDPLREQKAMEEQEMDDVLETEESAAAKNTEKDLWELVRESEVVWFGGKKRGRKRKREMDLDLVSVSQIEDGDDGQEEPLDEVVEPRGKKVRVKERARSRSRIKKEEEEEGHDPRFQYKSARYVDSGDDEPEKPAITPAAEEPNERTGEGLAQIVIGGEVEQQEVEKKKKKKKKKKRRELDDAVND